MNFERALKMLVTLRGDVMIENSFSMQYSLQQTLGGAEMLMMPTSMDQASFQLLASKRFTYLGQLPAFDAALRQFKCTPQYAKPYQR